MRALWLCHACLAPSGTCTPACLRTACLSRTPAGDEMPSAFSCRVRRRAQAPRRTPVRLELVRLSEAVPVEALHSASDTSKHCTLLLHLLCTASAWAQRAHCSVHTAQHSSIHVLTRPMAGCSAHPPRPATLAHTTHPHDLPACPCPSASLLPLPLAQVPGRPELC